MLISEILHILPANLNWMVLFDLSSISQFADETVIKAMYHLPGTIDLSPYSHVVLANTGHFLAYSHQSALIEVASGKQWTRDTQSVKPLADRNSSSLYDRFVNQLALFSVDEADCLGLGETAPYSPVLLHIKIQAGLGHAQAVFDQEPSRKHYELLQAVGVTFLGGEQRGSYYLAQFQNRLPVHIHAGILSHFTRTGHCNLFFLQHGTIDPPLETGLIKAAETRITWARTQSLEGLMSLVQDVNSRYAKRQASGLSQAMICHPPRPQAPFPYGDLVPLGFVLKALNTAIHSTDSGNVQKTHQAVTQHLLNHRQDSLWAFHTDRLITATDSALILQGIQDSESVEALERFADGKEGYYPQLWSSDRQPGKMKVDESCRHWCQVDYATTCMIRALRQDAGLDPKTSTDYLAAGMANRSGLYFANPYLVDWVTACAIAEHETNLRQQLLKEVLASMNQDYSFGTYDPSLSTSLAILTMAALGFRGRTMRAAQLRLLTFMDKQGLFPSVIPFYSSLQIDPATPTLALLGLLMANATSQQSIKKIQEQHYGISLYEDVQQSISTALAYLALSESCVPTRQDLPTPSSPTEAHPRYRCATHCDYIAKFALPPYLATTALIHA
jgi:hypothetical protein